MRKFHALKVAEVKRAAPDAVTVAFEVPAADAEIFRYREGQHITLRATVDGEELRRSYSIWPSVGENRLAVAIRKIDDGKFSGFANGVLKAGDVLDVFPPAGSFHAPDLAVSEARTYVAFAAGSGITPILSILKTTLEREPESRFLLFYGNRSGGTTLFREELSNLKNLFMTRLSVFHFLTRERQEVDFFNGRLDGEKVADILKSVIPAAAIDHAFLCGPAQMISEVQAALRAGGVPDERVHLELFHADPAPAKVAARKPVHAAEGAVRLTIKLDGIETRVPHPGGEMTLLDAAAAAGLEVPYSCKSGMCCTCRAKLLEGEVDMAVNYGLDEADRKAGFVLTCQAVPKTAIVRIDYDA